MTSRTAIAVSPDFTVIPPIADSGIQGGNPATSSISLANIFPNTSASWSGTASSTVWLGPGAAQVNAYVSLTGSVSYSNSTRGVEAMTFVDWQDAVTPTGLGSKAYLVIPFELTGTGTINRNTSVAAEQSVVSFGHNVCDSSAYVGGDSCGLTFDQGNSFVYTSDASGGINQTGIIKIPIAPTGTTSFEEQMLIRAIMRWGSINSFPGDQGTYAATAIGDFSHTGVFGPASLIDTDTGQPISGVTLTSDSGYDYFAGTTPVPEPSTLHLALACIALFGMAAHRRVHVLARSAR